MAALDLSAVTRSFEGTEVLRGIDLSVAPGELVVLAGPSGSGKSTLLRIIAGVDAPTSGEVRIDGEAVGDLAPARRGIAMVLHAHALYPHLTVRDNLGLGLRQAGASMEDVAARLERVSGLLSLGAHLERKPVELSGGQRQRVAIGRAIMRAPRLLLLDEPLSNLDAALRAEIRDEIAEL
ncbi:ABC transporter ATP-binding protein, partial [Methylobrevis pamukkalensis]|uniref:ABC transporter ATP-binding protein n=1 Tax=Methylobrevis pamukkalensis TaxID=1439726 RepID=UPI00114CF48B